MSKQDSKASSPRPLVNAPKAKTQKGSNVSLNAKITKMTQKKFTWQCISNKIRNISISFTIPSDATPLKASAIFGIRSFRAKCAALARSKAAMADFGEGCIDNILNVGVGCHEEWASGNVHAPIFDSNLQEGTKKNCNNNGFHFSLKLHTLDVSLYYFSFATSIIKVHLMKHAVNLTRFDRPKIFATYYCAY